MSDKEANTVDLKAKKAEKMLFRVTIWGAIIAGVFITLMIVFMK